MERFVQHSVLFVALMLLLLPGCIGESPPAEGTLAPGTLLMRAQTEAAGTLLVAAGILPPACGTVPDGSTSMHSHAWPLGDELDPLDAQVTNVSVTLTSHWVGAAGTNVDSNLALLGPDGSELGRASLTNLLFGETESVVLEGPFETGLFTIVVHGCLAINGDWSVRGAADIRVV